jgi:hypothetical protein
MEHTSPKGNDESLFGISEETISKAQGDRSLENILSFAPTTTTTFSSPASIPKRIGQQQVKGNAWTSRKSPDPYSEMFEMKLTPKSSKVRGAQSVISSFPPQIQVSQNYYYYYESHEGLESLANRFPLFDENDDGDAQGMEELWFARRLKMKKMAGGAIPFPSGGGATPLYL